MLDSVGVNPQTSKFHRFLVGSKKHNVDIDLGNKQHESYFNLAIAQAFGMGTDKVNANGITKFAEELRSTPIKELEEFLRTKEFNLGGKDYTIDHPAHVAQAIVSIEKANKSNKFKTTLTAEYDAVTSGFALKLMQMPVLSLHNMIEMLGKTGIFVNGHKDYTGDSKSFNEVNSKAGFVDAYQMLAKSVESKRKPPVDKVIKGQTIKADKYNLYEATQADSSVVEILAEDQSVTSAGRNLFKPGFMTWNYAASINSIKNALGHKLAEGVLKKALRIGGKAEMEQMMKRIGVTEDTLGKFQEDLATKDMELVTVNGINVYQELQSVYANSYGTAIEETMSERFGDVIEANNAIIASTKVMFRVYNEEFIKAKNEAEKDGQPMTEDAIVALVRSLSKKFPLIKAPYSDTVLDGVAIIDDSLVSASNTTLDSTQTRIRDEDNAKGRTLTIQSMVRELTEAHASGAVLPIHWIDGTVIGEALKEGGVLGVHDAIIPPLTDSGKKVLQYNTELYNVNKGYNLLQELMDSLKNSLSGMTNKEIGQIEKVQVVNVKGGLTAMEIVTDLQKVLDKSNAGREWLYSQAMTVNNVVALEGSTAIIEGKTSSVDESVKTYKLTVTAAPDKVKAPYKLSKSNKYIGYGVGSTQAYAEQLSEQGMSVNSGEYTSTDTVFASINGKGKLTPKNLQSTIAEVTKALEAGARVLTDSKEYLESKGKRTGANYTGYNTGEARLREALSNTGYINTTDKTNGNVSSWVKTTEVEPKTDSKQQEVVIDSNQTGLSYALTNPTHTSPRGFKWSRGDKLTRDYLSKGIKYKDGQYSDVEQAFQTLKDSAESKTRPTREVSNNYQLMVELIESKLKQYPRLVSGIDKEGGLNYLNRIIHQPTKQNSVWETGGQNWFKQALTEAYNNTKQQDGTILKLDSGHPTICS